jgi:hypothetical protein
MDTSLYRAKQSSIQIGIGEQILPPETWEREKKLQTELELWRQQVKKEAQLEASRGKGSLTLGGIEAQLRRISEQVTREAQEKQKRNRSHIQL